MSKSPDAFRTISEVAEWLDTPAHVLRFWESKFSQVKPVKRAGGRRYYRPADMALLAGIKKLLHEDGLTIKGAQKVLREQGVKYVSSLVPMDENGEAEPIEDAPFIEVEAPEPEDTLVAFPGSEPPADTTPMSQPVDAPTASAPDHHTEPATEQAASDVPDLSAPDVPDHTPDLLPEQAIAATDEQTETPQDDEKQETAPEAAFDMDDSVAQPAVEPAPDAPAETPGVQSIDAPNPPDQSNTAPPEPIATAQSPLPSVGESDGDTPAPSEESRPHSAPDADMISDSQASLFAPDALADPRDSSTSPEIGTDPDDASSIDEQAQPAPPDDAPAMAEPETDEPDAVSQEDAALDAMETASVTVDQEKAMQAAQRLAEQIVAEGIVEQAGPLHHLANLHRLGPTEARAFEPHLAALDRLYARLTSNISG